MGRMTGSDLGYGKSALAVLSCIDCCGGGVMDYMLLDFMEYLDLMLSTDTIIVYCSHVFVTDLSPLEIFLCIISLVACTHLMLLSLMLWMFPMLECLPFTLCLFCSRHIGAMCEKLCMISFLKQTVWTLPHFDSLSCLDLSCNIFLSTFLTFS